MYAAHQIIGETNLLIFLGFGFHRTNLERLQMQSYYGGERIKCTVYGRKKGEIIRDETVVTSYSKRRMTAEPLCRYV